MTKSASTTAAPSAGLFDKLDREMRLVERLAAHGAHVFDGNTDEPTRKERIRIAIQHHDLGPVLTGLRDPNGRPLTYSQAFQRLYLEPLNKPAREKSA
jgi:hypothetical protein